MELDSIEKLLEKYFEATTTEAEEEMLKAYFQEKVWQNIQNSIYLFFGIMIPLKGGTLYEASTFKK